MAFVSPDLDRLAVGSKAYGKALRAALRKQLTAVAKEGAQASKDKIRGMPVKGDVPYRQGGGLRQTIANATRASTAITAASGVSVNIRVAATGALAQYGRDRVAQLLDSGKPFRHPLFGEWVAGLPDQAAYPFFRTVIAERAPEMVTAINATLLEAAKLTLPNVT